MTTATVLGVATPVMEAVEDELLPTLMLELLLPPTAAPLLLEVEPPQADNVSAKIAVNAKPINAEPLLVLRPMCRYLYM